MKPAAFEIDDTGKTTLNLCDAAPDPLTASIDIWSECMEPGDAEISFPDEWDIL